MSDPRIKTLRIKTGVLKRMYKDTSSYQKEGVAIQEKIKKMQEDGEDLFYIKKQDGLLQETNAVVADCQKRLNTAFAELSTLIENEVELQQVEEYIAAKVVIQEARPHVTL